MIEFPIQKLDSFWVNVSKPVFAIAALIYPLLDTLRVFITRALKGQSPFNADRNHLHHKLIDCGFSHVKTVLIIYSFSIITIGASLLTYYFNQPTLSLITIVSTSLVFLIFVLSLYNRAAKKNVQ
jgi:multisubunit Na+/H+ antiporter MnhB subunit